MSSEGVAVPRHGLLVGAPDLQVRFTGVSKVFGRADRRSLARAALPFGRHLGTGVKALDAVDLEVRAGELLGIIGRNGSGKSTLLRLAAGVTQPSEGRVQVAGEPASMIELALPFHPQLTGRENLPVAAALFGMAPGEAEAAFEEIVAFSGIGPYLDLAVKHYSAGMVARLGFALATHLPAPVLLVDEVLAVGDRSFQQRCISRIRSLGEQGTAVMFVSHALDLVCQVCDRAIQLDQGRIVDDGPAMEVVGRYVTGQRHVARPTRSGGRILEVHIDPPVVSSGASMAVQCAVEIDETRPFSLRSEIVTPSRGSGVINLDRLPVGALGSPGTWRLSSRVGPLLSTAARLELLIGLEVDVGDGSVEVVDQAVVPFEVAGEDVGAIHMALDAIWSLQAAHDDEASHRDLPGGSADTTGAVWARNLTKRFTRSPLGPPHRRGDFLATAREDAISDVTFVVEEGEPVGLIGPNGSGKSTLLRVLAGVSEATSGDHGTTGRTTAVLDLEAGLHGDLTGSENVAFLWRLHGGSVAGFEDARRSIEEFAGLGPVLDQPVKHYSTGMRARLGLALALELAPDVLLIDEALSVGDIDFRERVRARLLHQVHNGTALIFASHDLHLLSSICRRVLRLDEGRLVDDAEADDALSRVGGVGWAGGTAIADGGIVVRDLRVTPDTLGWNQAFSVEFSVDVHRPNPEAYLEFSIRETLPPDERARPRSPEEVVWSTVALHRLRGLDDLLTTPGRKIVKGSIPGVPVVNSQDVVISAIDGFEGHVVSEQWHTTFFGASGEVTARFEVDWTVDVGS
jgi:ABC-type polysaccharide/polyol phosphate transport system ATPase subunit